MAMDLSDTENLLSRAGRDDGSAIGSLLEKHRQRLRQLIASRMDLRMATRLDPSDIVQETLIDARRKLPGYVLDRPLPYYAWLSRLALEKLAWWRRFHIGTSKRSVIREARGGQLRSHGTDSQFMNYLVAGGISASHQLIRDEENERARAILDSLTEPDRRVLHLRYFDELSFKEIATVLGQGLSSVKMRHLRALERFEGLMIASESESGR